MTKVDFKNILVGHILPWGVGLILFWVVCNHFFAPQTEGKSLQQGDINQYIGMSQDIREHREATGEDPQWTGNMFGGMPAYLIDIEYPTQDVKQSVGEVVKVVDGPMNMIYFAMVAMMLAVVLMGINPWIGIVAGLAYGLSTYFFLIIDAGHITKMWALVYAPPFVAAVWHTLRRNMWVGATLAALFGSLELAANHPQITYYFLLACVALWISELVVTIRNKGWKPFGKRTALLAIAALLAAGSNFAPLWYTATYSDSSIRTASKAKSEEQARQERIDYNTMWSYGKAESLNMLVANYRGHSSPSMRTGQSVDDFLASGGVAPGVAEFVASPEVEDELYNSAFNQALYEVAYHYFDGDINLLYQLYAEGDREVVRVVDEYTDMILNYDLKFQLGRIGSAYWGDQPGTGGPTYIGATVIFLALIGLLLCTGRNRWWILAISLIALPLAWGSNIMWLYEILYDWLPGYKSLRTVSMALVIIEWSAPLMAAVALAKLWNSTLPLKSLLVRIGIAVAIVIALLVLALICVGDYGAEQLKQMLDEEWWITLKLRDVIAEGRKAAFMADLWRSIGFVVATAIVVVVYAVVRNLKNIPERLKSLMPYALVAVVGIFVVWDLCGVNDRYLYAEKWSDKAPTEIVQTAADRQIKQSIQLGERVYDKTSIQTSRASYFHRSIDGYNGAKMSRYNDVLNAYIYPEARSKANPNPRTEPNDNILAMLNTRYIIVNQQSAEPHPTYGAAWLVHRPIYTTSPAEELEAIGRIDLQTEAVVAADIKGLDEEYDTSGSIALVEYTPNYLKYEYEAPNKSLAVFSEIYYDKGWTAYIDGHEADYFIVDYILRGMELPAGKHTIEWRFKAPNWGVTTAITGISSWLILVALLLLITSPITKAYIWPHIAKRVCKKDRENQPTSSNE